MKDINNAILVGSNWGLIHLLPLRQAGLHISALLGTDLSKTQQIAAEQGIPLGTTQRERLDDPDLVVIACPAKQHRLLIEQFPHSAIICEKPLQGVDDYPQPLPPWADKLWVNYAFSQLTTAQTASKILRNWEQLECINLRSTVNLPLDFTIEQWFLETASHPLSWLLHLLGEPSLKRRHSQDQQLLLSLDCNGTEINVEFQFGGEPGIFHQLDFKGDGQSLSFSGCYRPEEKWRFSPIMLNGDAVNQGEYTDSDCWMDANQRSVQLILKVFRGELTAEQGLALGLFNAEKALYLERLICS